MKKIISLFQRNHEADHKRGRLVFDSVTPGAEWVIRGEGYATRKWDGVAVLIKDGLAYMRFDLKQGRKEPEGFIPAQDAPDPITGHWPGWVSAQSTAGKYVMEAVNWWREQHEQLPDGTYEACGPKIGTRHGANPEKLSEHRLFQHGDVALEDAPRDFDGLKAYLKDSPIEGIVWHHPVTGQMVKIKKADFPQ